MNDWLSKRQQAASRRRRILFNNDGDDVYFCKEPTRESFLAARSNGLEKTNVDTYVYSCMGNFDSCSFDSRVAEVGHNTDQFYLPRNHAQVFIDQGHDNLSMIIDFCRENGLEVFWSARMNDMHDNWDPRNMTTFRREHPELRLWRDGDYGRPGDGTVEPHMFAVSMDYGKEEIRRRMFDIIIDVCERYDVGGIELDFMREPMHFRPNMEGRPAEQEHLDIMTEFVRRIRAKVDEIGQQRGRPILINTRVPNLLGRCRYMGLDVERWITEHLLDMIIPSLEFTPFTGDITEITSLAHAHGMSVYPCIGGGVDGVGGCADGVGWVAATTNALASGADGIATFNNFDPHFPAWSVLGDPAAMRESDKAYAVENINSAMSTHWHVADVDGLLPVKLADGLRSEVVMPVREDLTARKTQTRLYLTATIDGCAFGDRVELSMNGTPMKTELVETTDGIAPLAVGRITYRAIVDPALMLCGDNHVGVLVDEIKPRTEPPVLCQLRFIVKGAA